jgi:hypothetical protein
VARARVRRPFGYARMEWPKRPVKEVGEWNAGFGLSKRETMDLSSGVDGIVGTARVAAQDAMNRDRVCDGGRMAGWHVARARKRRKACWSAFLASIKLRPSPILSVSAARLLGMTTCS